MNLASMKSFLLILLKHPVSVVCYGFYTWLCYGMYADRIEHRRWLKVHPRDPHALGYGEGIAYMVIFLIIIGTILGLVLLINALALKELAFYGWLIAIVFAQTILVLNIR